MIGTILLFVAAAFCAYQWSMHGLGQTFEVVSTDDFGMHYTVTTKKGGTVEKTCVWSMSNFHLSTREMEWVAARSMENVEAKRIKIQEDRKALGLPEIVWED